jgi:hypothetical protein
MVENLFCGFLGGMSAEILVRKARKIGGAMKI